MQLIELTRFSEKNNSGKRKQLGLFLCSCGNTQEVSVSEVKNGYKKGCNKCWRKRAGITSRNVDIETAVNSAYAKIRAQANIRKLEFSITKEEAKVQFISNCYYCNSTGTSFKLRSVGLNGLDRLDSSKGYTLENCVPCCKKCNLAKHTMSEQEYINHCITVATFKGA